MDDLLFSMPYWCDDCETWHQSHYWISDDPDCPYTVCDDDGNHDPIDEADLPDFAEQEKAWHEYSDWVVRHGTDPLGEFYVKHSRKVQERWRFRFADSVLGPLLVEAQRAGERYWWNEVPEHVRQYLNLAPVGFPARGKVDAFATWAELVAAQPGIKPDHWWSVTIEHDEPRNEVVVARELRRLARKHLGNPL